MGFIVVFGIFFVRLWRRVRRYESDGETTTAMNHKGAA